MKLIRYFKRKRYMQGIGWYINLSGNYVSSHGTMIVSKYDVYQMSDEQFKVLCPYFVL